MLPCEAPAVLVGARGHLARALASKVCSPPGLAGAFGRTIRVLNTAMSQSVGTMAFLFSLYCWRCIVLATELALYVSLSSRAEGAGLF